MTTGLDKPSTNGHATPADLGKAADKAAQQTADDAQITIQRIGRKTMIVPIIGTSPLIISKFSEKSKRQMLEAQQGKKNPKQHRDPDREFRDALYHMDGGGYGFPAIGFKAATVGACRFYGKSITMTALRQYLFFGGEFSNAERQKLVRIDSGEPVMREDIVRLAGAARTADLRYRPEFTEWRAELVIMYVANCIDRDSVLSLVDAGGMGVGVGEWRPERKGDMGTYTIDPDRAIAEVD